SNVTITTDNVTNDGNVGISGTVNADVGTNRRSLTIAAGGGTIDNGSGGAIGAVGGTQALGNITLTGSTIRLGAVTTTGGSNQDGGALVVTGSGAVTVGAITTTAGAYLASNPGHNAGAITITGSTVPGGGRSGNGPTAH